MAAWRRHADSSKVFRGHGKIDHRLQSDKENVNLIYYKIGEEVEAELDCQLEGEFRLLRRSLKSSKGATARRDRCLLCSAYLFSNKQRRGEDIRTYSHRIKAAFDAVVKKQQDTSATVSQS